MRAPFGAGRDAPLRRALLGRGLYARPPASWRAASSVACAASAPDEILVVDNAPARAVRARRRRSVSRRAVRRRAAAGAQRRPQYGHPRAHGRARAFTDDDVTVDPPGPRSRGGRLRAERRRHGPRPSGVLDTEAQRRFEQERAASAGAPRPRFDDDFFRAWRWGVPVWQIGAGANMAFRRGASPIGGFDERLGAGTSGCSEDSELWYRLLAAGGACRYDRPRSLYHLPPARACAELRRQHAGIHARPRGRAPRAASARHGGCRQPLPALRSPPRVLPDAGAHRAALPPVASTGTSLARSRGVSPESLYFLRRPSDRTAPTIATAVRASKPAALTR